MSTALPLLCLAYALGIFAGDALALGPGAGRLLLGLAGAALLLALRRGRGTGPALLALAVALGLGAQARRPAPPPWLPRGEPVRAEGVVRAAPETGPHGAALVVALSRVQLRADGPWQATDLRLGLLVHGEIRPALLPGDRVRLRAVLRPPEGLHNPGAPDARRRAAAEGLHALAEVPPGAILPLEDAAPPAWSLALCRAAALLRARMLGALRERLPPAAGGDDRRFALLAALTLGLRGPLLGTSLDESFRRAGVYHVLSVSGLHLAAAAALLSWTLLALLRRTPLCRRVPARRCAALLALPATLFYTVLTGAALATERAAGMAALCFLAIACGRRARLGEALPGALLVLLSPLGAPLALFDPALQLSVAATLGVAYLRPRLAPARGGRLLGVPARLRRLALGLVLAALGATLATAPLCALHFGEFQGAGLLGALTVVPLGELLVLPAGLLGGLVSLAAPSLGGPLLDLAGAGALAMALLADRIAALGLVAVAPAPGAAALVLWILGLVLLGPRPRAGALLLGAALALYLVPRALPGRELRATFLDVGQGDAAVLELPGGQVLVVDGGPAGPGFDPGERVILPHLRRRGRARIDLMVLSHPHPDHFGGLVSLLQRVPVGLLWTAEAGRAAGDRSGEPLDQGFLRLLEIARRRGVPVERPRPLRLGAVHIEPLAPCASGPGCSVRPDAALGHNDNSLALHIRYGGRSLLLLGDLELKGELRLLEHLDGRPEVARPVDVLKVPHHCSRTSSSESLLRELGPRLAVCSLGRDNRHGFPHAEVLHRYRSLGVPLLRTDERGAITVRITAAGALEPETVLPPP